MRKFLRRLACHRDIPGYRRLSFARRLGIDLRVAAGIVRSAGFLRLCAWTIAAWLAALILCFEYDLYGWRRDAVRALPVFVTLPWLLMARRCRLPAALRSDRRASR